MTGRHKKQIRRRTKIHDQDRNQNTRTKNKKHPGEFISDILPYYTPEKTLENTHQQTSHRPYLTQVKLSSKIPNYSIPYIFLHRTGFCGEPKINAKERAMNISEWHTETVSIVIITKKKEERMRGQSRSSSSPKERPLPQTRYNAYRSHLSLCTCMPYFIMIL